MKKFPIFAILFLLIGCATSSHIITGKTRPPISADAVKIYSEMPPWAEEVAILKGNDTLTPSYTGRAINAMKERAALLGANGLILQGSKADNWTGAEVSAKAIYVP